MLKEKITTILKLVKTYDVQDKKNEKQQKTIKRHLHIKEKGKTLLQITNFCKWKNEKMKNETKKKIIANWD